MSVYSAPVIIWLDEHNARPDFCETLWRTFSGAVKSERSCPTPPDNISTDEVVKIKFEEDSHSSTTSAITMYAVTNEEDCVQCLQINKDKRVFLFVSNLSGEYIVSRIKECYREIFEKTVENQCVWVYVCCLDSADELYFNIDHAEDFLAYDHEPALLVQVIRDLGDYFVILGEKECDYDTPAPLRQEHRYFRWAKALHIRANGLEKSIVSDTLEPFIALPSLSAESLPQQRMDDDDIINQHIAFSGVCSELDVNISEVNQEEKLAAQLASFPSKVVNVEHSVFPKESNGAIASDYMKEKPTETMETYDDTHKKSSHLGVFRVMASSRIATSETICSLFKQLFDINLIVMQDGPDHLKQLQLFDMSIVVLLFPSDDDKLILEELCSLSHPPSIYVLGSPPNGVAEKQVFFERYYAVCAMVNNPEQLAVKIAIDVATKSRIIGDRCARKYDKDHANKLYDQSIDNLNRLNDFAHKKMCNED